MIEGLEAPEYYIHSVDLEVNPTIGQREVGQVGMDFSMEDPKLNESPEGFSCQSILELELYREGGAPWEGEEDSESEFGEITIETTIFNPGDHSSFERYVEEWNEESYQKIDRQFAHHLESGILQNVINPIGDLLSNSFNGVVPRLIFSHPKTADEVEEE